MEFQRVGMYAWGGPGTIRILKTKYHNPKIDTESYDTLYDETFLAKSKKEFGITDMWVTYSWGYSNKTEREDWKFIEEKLENFKKQKIKAHAYIQGFNVVTSEFKKDIFCRNTRGGLIPYSKGRSLTCPNNPKALKIILDRVDKACKKDFDGIFIDNIVFGFPPLLIRKNYIPFFGCYCRYCQLRFKKEFGYELPKKGFRDKTIVDYLSMRNRSVYEALEKISSVVTASKKEFGVNLYDPVMVTPEFFMGYKLADIDKLLTYYLIENVSFPTRKRNNSYLQSFIKNSKKPVFIVSYKKGIGFDSTYAQQDINHIFSEAEQLGYFPCLKTSEFKTKKIWHCLNISALHKPKREMINFDETLFKPVKVRRGFFFDRVIGRYLVSRVPSMTERVLKRRLLDMIFEKTRMYQRLLKKNRNYALEEFLREL